MKETRHGSIIVRDKDENMEIAATHQGGIVHGGRVVIEKADVYDLYKALREHLAERMCLECGAGDPRCQCWNDE